MVTGQSPLLRKIKVVLSLVNIEQSTSQSVPVRGGPPTGPGVRFPPLVLTNLYVLILANFMGENYPTGLGLISRVIGFMQDNPVLNHSSLPGLDAAIDSLSFEFVNLDASQWSLYLKMAGCDLFTRGDVPGAHRSPPVKSGQCDLECSDTGGREGVDEPAATRLHG